MFVEERQDLILKQMLEKGSVRVKELSERFNVTEDLIRKDLSTLEKAGKCKKIYGGAIPTKQNVNRKKASERKTLNLEGKRVIAQKAIDLIKEGNVVFLDISTTVVELARQIAQQNLNITVVTNSLEAVNLLISSDVNVIFIGGELDYGKDGFVGSLADQMLENFHFDAAFLGVVGLDLEENAVYTYMAKDGVTKKMVIDRSKIIYLLADHEKFNQIGNYKYSTIDSVTGLITDQKLNSVQRKYCRKYGIEYLD